MSRETQNPVSLAQAKQTRPIPRQKPVINTTANGVKNIDFKLSDFKKLAVNGMEFNILMADVDILEKADSLKRKYEYISVKENNASYDEIVAAVREVASVIDSILGDGALKEIAQGRPVGLVETMQLMGMISTVVFETYKDDVKKNYE